MVVCFVVSDLFVYMSGDLHNALVDLFDVWVCLFCGFDCYAVCV